MHVSICGTLLDHVQRQGPSGRCDVHGVYRYALTFSLNDCCSLSAWGVREVCGFRPYHVLGGECKTGIAKCVCEQLPPLEFFAYPPPRPLHFTAPSLAFRSLPTRVWRPGRGTMPPMPSSKARWGEGIGIYRGKFSVGVFMKGKFSHENQHEKHWK